MNNFENPQNKNETVGDGGRTEAYNYIMYIRQQVAVMGFNDSEIPELSALAESVKNGEADVKEAKARALEIMNNKQDYH